MTAQVFHRLVSIDDAIRLINEVVKPSPLGVEVIDLTRALYRVLAENIYSPIDYPPFDRSEVDGFAVRSIDVAMAQELHPIRLKIAGYLKPGEASLEYRCLESAIKVATGSPIPVECDTVVMAEYTEEINGYVYVYKSSAPGDNISTTGSDISRGDLILPRGTMIRHEHIALLAGLGLKHIPVYVKPRAIVFSTGDEIVEPGSELTQGKVYDANGYLIASYLSELGVEVEYGGVLPDNYDQVYDVIKSSIERYDLLFTSGGTSAGESDIVYRVFGDLGRILVHGLKSKPGKPTVVAIANNKLLIGLPGFPLSCYMILTRLVRPIITKITGLHDIEIKTRVRIPFKIRKGIGKTWLIPSLIVETPRGLVAYPITLSSGSLQAITFSDGFIEIGEDVDVVDADTEVDFYLFPGRTTTRKLVIIGSNDPLLEHILQESGLLYVSRILNTGSTGGWLAVKRGEADIAPTHLLDVETQRYNVPFLERFELKDKAILLRGYDRLVGFIVAKGNPKGIRGFRDLFRDDVRIVNRPKGSGIRTLLDYNLKLVARDLGLDQERLYRLVKGYTYEVKTHNAVALAVKTGRADVGIACGYVAELYDLDFMPLTWEEFDFLVPRERLDKPEIRRFIDSLKKLNLEDFRLSRYYRVPSNIGEPRVS